MPLMCMDSREVRFLEDEQLTVEERERRVAMLDFDAMSEAEVDELLADAFDGLCSRRPSC